MIDPVSSVARAPLTKALADIRRRLPALHLRAINHRTKGLTQSTGIEHQINILRRRG
jgi:hypothetical protein